MQPNEIGKALAVMGFVSIFMKLSMPFFLRRFGVINTFSVCMQSWPITFAAMPVLSFIAKSADNANQGPVEWTAMTFVLFLSRVGCLAFS